MESKRYYYIITVSINLLSVKIFQKKKKVTCELQYISVDEVTGEIKVRQRLDHELESVYDFVVVPFNGSEKSTHVYIIVVDENDNTPKFPVPVISIEISEYASLHSEISIPAAVDEDSPPFSVQKYRIKSGNVNNAFKLSVKKINSVSYVDLIVNGELDREYRDHYDLVIEALDGGSPPNIGTLRVNVTILDANDNSPEFTESRYTAEIPWNVTVGYKIITVQANDPDLGPNSLVSYSIIENHPDQKTFFTIDSTTGVVSVVNDSFVPGSIHELLIVASDHGIPQPLQTTTFLTVIVSKSTEPTPHFDLFWLTDSGLPEVYENTTVGYVLARLSVQNVKKTRYLKQIIMIMMIMCLEQTQKQDVYLALACNKLFDREYKGSYNLNFLVKDDNVVVLEHPVVLEVLDINDNSPQFENSLLRVVYNRSAEDENVVRIAATDADIGENARIRYSLSGSELFTIEPETGVLHLKQTFRCPNGEVHFHVTATDNGVPSLSTTVDVIVDVVESNEHAPVFLKPLYEIHVREDVEVGTCLLEVSAFGHCAY
uniref:Cadherin n=1 Tax=Syphacia muris TaxID=451379 RepID=A0A0N5AIL7_9BILA